MASINFFFFFFFCCAARCAHGISEKAIISRQASAEHRNNIGAADASRYQRLRAALAACAIAFSGRRVCARVMKGENKHQAAAASAQIGGRHSASA